MKATVEKRMTENRTRLPERRLMGVAVIVLRSDRVLLGKRKNSRGD